MAFKVSLLHVLGGKVHANNSVNGINIKLLAREYIEVQIIRLFYEMTGDILGFNELY
jgi:hypothetical protein